MLDYATITLSNGLSVKVYPVPPYVTSAVLAKFRDPPIPNRPVNPEVDIPGLNQQIPDPDNPEYKRQLNEISMKRGEAFVNARLLYGLRDERPPEGWPTEEDRQTWEFLGAEIDVPGSGEGRRLAWVKFGLIQAGQDMEKIMAAIDSFLMLDKEEVTDLVESFRSQGQGRPAK